MPNKTLYVRESDLALWELVQKQLGQQSVSALFAEFLRERVKAMNVFVRVLRAGPNSQQLVVTFAPTGPDGTGGSLAPHYVSEPQLITYLEGQGIAKSAASKIGEELKGSSSVSELTAMALPQK
jgi:hypothetical protein